jgi:HD-GYP domain-containing protein (c-di-GMP phosphodiesterase class II)
VYRPKRPVSEALEELRRVAGTQLDPDCVEAFIRWLERTGRLDDYTLGASRPAA